MHTVAMRRFRALGAFLCLVSTGVATLAAQDLPSGSGPSPSSAAPQTAAEAGLSPVSAQEGQSPAAPVPGSRLVPVFPDSTPDFAIVEGESAVSTNMATEPTLVYGCSSNRTLQLSKTGRLPGDAAYYAEFVVYLETEGAFEFWYGGTPPGPKDELTPSLSSPFQLIVDAGKPRAIYREDVNVVEQYAPAYYWMKGPTLSLSKGTHVLRLEVTEKRRFDERFFFYLDCLFLLREGTKASAMPRPEIFPKDLAARNIDKSFRSIEDYQAFIQSNPTATFAYVELSTVYSLLGDYLSALKTLSKAVLLAPKDPMVRLLTAKNRIWRGDVKEGLAAYRAYLDLKKDDKAGFDEAGKIAAWTGRFADSKTFYRDGLSAFPGDLSMLVNLGLVQLWNSEAREAEKSFSEAEATALSGDDSKPVTRLASIYNSNGYPERSVNLLEKAIAVLPDRLELRFALEETWATIGKTEKADEVQAAIAREFEASDRLATLLDVFLARRDLKADRIAALEARLAEHPDDITLREELTQVYFWNGLKEKAVRQLEATLAAYLFKAAQESAAADLTLAECRAAALVLRATIDEELANLGRFTDEADVRLKALGQAEAALAAWEKKKADAEKAGKSLSAADGETLIAKVQAIGDSLVVSASGIRTSQDRLVALIEAGKARRISYEALVAAESLEDETFKKLSAASRWKWDGRGSIVELAELAARGEEIASWLLGRSYEAVGDPRSALSAYAKLSGEALAASKAEGLLAASLRADPKSAAALPRRDLAEDAPRQLKAAAADLRGYLAVEDSGIPAGFSAAEALPTIREPTAELKKAAAAIKAELGFAADGAAIMRDKRWSRVYYGFEEAQAFRRASLGAYYEGLGLSARAVIQYRRVLAVDPTNIAARYNLALAEERSGDWAKASSLLKAVYDADPEYGATARSYNAIARAHAPSVEVEGAMIGDSNRISGRSVAKTTMPLGSLVSFKAGAGVETVLERSAGLPAYLVATLNGELPFVFSAPSSGLGLTLKPRASILGSSSAFALNGIGSWTPEEALDSLDIFTAGAVDLEWSSGPAYGSASYSYAPLAETLSPSRIPYYAHRAELAVAAYFSLPGNLRYVAPRLYGTGSYVPIDGNVFGLALVEVTPAFKLSDSPWSNVGIPLGAMLELARKPRSTPYYAGNGAMTLKGGLSYQSSFSVGEGESLVLFAQAQSGLYRGQVFSETPTKDYLHLSALLRLDWNREGSNYFFVAEFSGTDVFETSPAYWSLAFVVGLSGRQPKLIAP